MRLRALSYLSLPLCLALLLSISLFSGPLYAKEKELGTFGVWRAYSSEEGGQNVCYMTTMKVQGGGKNQRIRYLMITHRPTEGSSDVFSFGAGVPLDSKHGVTLKVGKEAFDLFSARDTAWAREALTDHKISAALRSSQSASVSAIAAQSKASTLNEQFPLNGASQAYSAINKACGMPDSESRAEVKKEEARKPGAKSVGDNKTGSKKREVKKPSVKKQAAVPANKAKTAAAKASTGKKDVKKAPAKKKAAKTPTAAHKSGLVHS